MKNLLPSLALLALLPRLAAAPENRIVWNVNASPEHQRNTEGAFITLKSGRIALYYSQFESGKEDYSRGSVAEVHSDDQGLSWSSPRVVFPHGDFLNAGSVSLLRLADGRIAILYAVKRSNLDCRPLIRFSDDETATWSEPRNIIDAPGYFVVNNDRLIQTRSGRLIVPAAFHRALVPVDRGATTVDSRAITLWYLSDDAGRTWRQSETWWSIPVRSESGLQEPGVVELADGTLFSWARTDRGCEYAFRSTDGGTTWSAPVPTDLKSPLSPASIKRLPGSDALLAIYDDHSGRFPFDPSRRAPLVAAVSRDGGRTWGLQRVLEGATMNWYCYTSIHFTGGHALLAYWVKDDKLTPETIAKGRMGRLRIRRVDPSWFLQTEK